MPDFTIRVHTRWAIHEGKHFDDPTPTPDGGYQAGRIKIPAHAVAWEEYAEAPSVSPRKLGIIDRILSALDAMGGSARSKNALYKAVGGNRPDFMRALNTAESRGLVAVEGTKVSVVDT